MSSIIGAISLPFDVMEVFTMFRGVFDALPTSIKFVVAGGFSLSCLFVSIKLLV